MTQQASEKQCSMLFFEERQQSTKGLPISCDKVLTDECKVKDNQYIKIMPKRYEISFKHWVIRKLKQKVLLQYCNDKVKTRFWNEKKMLFSEQSL